MVAVESSLSFTPPVNKEWTNNPLCSQKQRNKALTLAHIHRWLICKGDTSIHAQGTDPKVALGASGELPGIYLGAWGGSRRQDPSGCLIP